jgi:hypothetical protein
MQTNVLREIVSPTGTIDFFNTITVEQLLLNGDPAVTLYPHPLPDYVVEEPLIKVNPANLNVTNSSFNLDVKFQNIGKASKDSVRIKIVRQKADGVEDFLVNEVRKAVNHSDSIQLSVAIDPLKDRGQNKIIVTLDPTFAVPEISEANNTAIKSFVIADDDVRPAFPAEFAIVNTQGVKLKASTSRFLKTLAEFQLELDTTALFNSPLKFIQKQNSSGGVIEFTPTLQFVDSTVYYWRVAKKPDTGIVYNWANSSFVYLPNSGPGWSQSHYYQFLRNTYNNSNLSFFNNLQFDKVENLIRITTGLLPGNINTIFKNLTRLTNSGCSETLNSLEFLIFDLKSGQPLRNSQDGTTGRFGSYYSPTCTPGTPFQFDFSYNNAVSRKNAMDFFDLLPNGHKIIMYNWARSTSVNQLIDIWKGDTLINGKNKSLYHKLKEVGFSRIDSLYKNIPFLFIATKDNSGQWFVEYQEVATGTLPINSSTILAAPDDNGSMQSTVVGPALSWNKLLWDNSKRVDAPGERVVTSIYGISKDKSENFIFSTTKIQGDTTLSFIDPLIFPNIRIVQQFKDSLRNSPSLSSLIQVNYNAVPEGAIVPTAITSFKDTVETGEKIRLSTGFRNISDVAFDSVKVIMTVTDETNQTKLVIDQKRRPIAVGDSIVVDYLLDTKDIKGTSSVFVIFNPEFAQPEQYLFNNYQTIPLSVTPDKTPPNLDVTFDGIRILNKDIVSAKPFIVMTLKDDSRYLALNDTSLFTIKLKMPDGNLKNVRFDGDTLKFIPASLDAVGKENAATVHYRPHLMQDGEYELIVYAKDRSNNASGTIDYSVAFEVVNKSMISNLLNYPNPFTTSTAFVFTLTGSELPSQFRIQIMTITGKIVKEINKEELGPLRIGNNITEYKWDGRDQFGQPLANGVYLYRVVADMNGKKIEKLNSGAFNTDKYFQSGYGKMYLMR